MHSLAEGLENKSVIANCYFDLSKAFDRVWHEELLAKLAHVGISGALFAWFEGYLKGRVQRVRVDTATSTWKLIPAGVPQGSVLGPLLFNIYTSDLSSHIPSSVECNQFADDTALCSIAPSRNVCFNELQKAMMNTGEWLRDWRLSVNLSKTNVMVTSVFTKQSGRP